jgi:pantoate--beta-alanine ligase
MIRDLDLPVRLEALPTVRETDGLALSSRNRLLGPEDRVRALALSRALHAAQQAATGGERDVEHVRELASAELQGVDAEYVAIVDADSFAPLRRLDGRALVAVAARVGPVRLIDNVVLQPVPVATG